MINTEQIVTLDFHQSTLREATMMEIVIQTIHHPRLALCGNQTQLVMRNLTNIQELLKAVRIYINRKIPTTQSCLNIRTEHLGIASRNENLVFAISQSASKLLPRRNILNLIQEKHRTFVVHLKMSFQYEIKILGRESL